MEILSTDTRSGIYRIVCKVTGMMYIGSAVSLIRRKRVHQHLLRDNEHHSNYLQHAWTKYGEEAFLFEVIEYVPRAQLIEREQYWLDQRRFETGNDGFNMTPFAGSTMGIQYTEIAVKNIRSAAAKKRGRPLSERQKQAYQFRRERGLTDRQKEKYERDKVRPRSAKELAHYQRMKEKGAPRSFIEATEKRKREGLSAEHRANIQKGVRKIFTERGEEILTAQSEGLKRAHARRTPEQRASIHQKISEAQKGKIISDEAKMKFALTIQARK